MKLLVFSDSHGNSERMLRAIEHFSPDMVLHLGDGGRDIAKIKSQFPDMPLKAVKGNCDISSSLPEREIISVNGAKLFLTHGHHYSVKSTASLIISEAVSLGANAVLFGHTHKSVNYYDQGVLVINPGTAGYPPMQTCAVLEISDRGELLSRIIRL